MVPVDGAAATSHIVRSAILIVSAKIKSGPKPLLFTAGRLHLFIGLGILVNMLMGMVAGAGIEPARNPVMSRRPSHLATLR